MIVCLAVWLALLRVSEQLLSTVASHDRSPVLAFGMALVAKLDTVCFPRSLIHIWESYASADQTFSLKMKHTDSALVQAVCTA